MSVRLADHTQCRRGRLHLLSGGFLAFTVAGRHTLSRQETPNNDLMGKRHKCVHLGFPQQMWVCCHRVSEGFRASRGPLLVLDIYRKSTEDSALFWYEWGLLNGKATRGYACMNTNTQKRNRTTEQLFCWFFTLKSEYWARASEREWTCNAVELNINSALTELEAQADDGQRGPAHHHQKEEAVTSQHLIMWLVRVPVRQPSRPRPIPAVWTQGERDVMRGYIVW